MLIRVSTKYDYEAVLELMGVLNPEDPKIPNSVSESVYSNILKSANFTIIVAALNSTIVGTCYINIILNLTRCASPYGVIENVVTHPRFRRQGIGRALITHALNFARNEGCYKMMLLTGGDQNVLEFYESCGMKSGIKTAFIERWEI